MKTIFITVLIWAAICCLTVFFVKCAEGARPLEFAETELVPLEFHNDNLLDLDRPLFRLGEVMKVASSDRLCVIFDYRFSGNQWYYTVKKAHYANEKTR